MYPDEMNDPQDEHDPQQEQTWGERGPVVPFECLLTTGDKAWLASIKILVAGMFWSDSWPAGNEVRP